MSGFDDIIWNNLERLLSPDLNAAQALQQRMTSDMMRELLEAQVYTATNPAGSPRNVVVGGLEVSPSGTDVAVALGALLQDSAVLAPVPTAIDSTYRLGVLRSATVVAMPVPGVNSWVLIEAQVVRNVTLNEPRDIWNPATSSFGPAAVDKRSERNITFQITTLAAQVPVPAGGDWVPIAVVRRPAGGGPVLASDIHDLRPMAYDQMGREGVSRSPGAAITIARREDNFLRTSSVPGTPSNLIRFHAEAFLSGRRMWVETIGAVDITGVLFTEPGLVLAGSTFYYLYLAPFASTHLPANQTASCAGRGLLMLSATGPAGGQGTTVNTAPITPPAPWDTAALGSGEAVCVGALYRNAANTGWATQISTHDRMSVSESIQVHGAAAVAVNNFNLTTFVPTNARSARIRVYIDGDSGTPGSDDGGWTVGVGGAGVTYINMGATDFGRSNSTVVDIPVSVSLSWDILLSAPNLPSQLFLFLEGWST
jgi:hypothetical protein